MSQQPVTGAPTGNGFLDTLNGLLTVSTGVFDRWAEYTNDREAAKIAEAQASTAPNIIVTAPTSNGLNFLSNPESLQKGFLYGGIALSLTALGYFILKKV